MENPVKILLLEHDSSDIDLITYELKKSGITHITEVVGTRESYTASLHNFKPDIILSDMSLPAFDGMSAFRMRQSISAHVPFIFVSGTAREQDIPELLNMGLTDYVFKTELSTLSYKICKALRSLTLRAAAKPADAERMLVEATLKRSQANLKTMLDNADNAYIMFDRHLNIVLFNPLAQTFTRQELKQVLAEGHYALDYFPADRQDFIREQMNLALKGHNVSYEVSYPQEHGSDTYYSVRFFPVSSEEWDVFGIIMALSDITEQRHSEKRKEFERNNLSSLINNIDDLIWSVDSEFRLISCNQAFTHFVQAFTGLVMEPGQNVLIQELDNSLTTMYKSHYERAFSGERFKVLEHVEHPSQLWLEVSFYPILEDGQVKGTACYAHDITAMKKFERELEDSNNQLTMVKDQLEHNEWRLKQAQAVAHVGSWELSFNSGITTWSDEAYRIYGLEPGDHRMTMQDWLEFIHPEDLDHVRESIAHSEKTLENLAFFHRIIRKDGVIRQVRTESRHELDPAGIPIGLYGIVHDITENRNNEMRLKRSLELAGNQNKRLQNFAYIVSHNIRSHSANINGLLSVIDECRDETERQELSRMLLTSARQLEKTIDNLNDIITVQNQEKQEYSLLALRKEIGKTVDVINYMVLDAGAKIINLVDDNISVCVIPTYLDSILLNLLTNAVKYRSADRSLEICVSAEMRGNDIILRVSDNGLGIDLDKNREKIFGMYKTFHDHPDAKGFGLYMTKNQVEAMNGRIEVQSEPGKGSEFIVYLNGTY